MTEVRIEWLASGDATPAVLEEAGRWLEASERERLARLRLESVRREFLLGRWLARNALAAWTGIPAEEWWFESGPHGRPEPRTADAGVSPPSLNLSHGGSLVVCASAIDTVVGVDVEAVSRDLPSERIERFFAAEEAAELRALSSVTARADRFWRLWTLKEAWLKAQGTGITGGLASFAIRFHDPDPPTVTGAPGADRWSLFELRPTPEHRLGVAARPPGSSRCCCSIRRIRP